jgi:methyl-accepting chemotaxis protein
MAGRTHKGGKKMDLDIINFELRIEKIEDALVDAAAGDFREIDVNEDDTLASIEMGLNLLLSDLKYEIDTTTKLIKKEQVLDIFLDYSNFAKRATEQIKEGKLDIKLPPKTGIPEINEMRDSFNFLISTIRLLISNLEDGGNNIEN